ncbi:Threonine/homoserine/homoserine lactone efflux protein [Algoriella xinjiangensis]|uniref:Threonine/homoserine/homoserine lactone efflux protein n=1 Tax=Algoriella xinjiangensis TaxID=684065 RepID=A0A1I4SC47_9FLAO|nr:LysE family transporter [Algoriella xinjiangensis]SFM61863.1 Threonine/homoserine/homoserine lactone efflux protein [Algoriella xinjiangensis]VDH15994.1 LysE type translocator [Algoriella xinjiangensis]
MQYIELLLIGIFTALLGTSLPGLLNMTVVKIGKNEGYKSAYTFISGVSVVIAIQVYLAIFFAEFINFNEKVTLLFREIGLFVFIVLTIYFLFFAEKIDRKKQEKKLENNEVKKKNKFIYGLFLAAINIFPIPFYVFLSATLVSYNVIVFGNPNSSIFTLGVVIGSLIMFYLYLRFFNNKSKDNSFILKNINYVIGGVTSVVSLLTIYQLVK